MSRAARTTAAPADRTASTPRVLTCAILVAVVGLALAPMTTQYLAPLTALSLSGTICGASYLILAARAGHLRPLVWLIPLAGLAVSTLLSSGAQSLQGLRVYALIALLWAACSKLGNSDPLSARVIVRVFTLGAAFAGLLTLSQLASGNWGLADQIAVSTSYTSAQFPGRTASWFGHPIILGSTLSAALVLSMYVWKGPLRVLTIVLCAAGVLSSGSRGAWLATAIALGLAFVLSRRSWQNPRALALSFWSAILITIISLTGYLLRPESFQSMAAFFTERLTGLGQISTSAREVRIQYAINAITQDPARLIVGNGPWSVGTFFESTSIGDTQAIVFDNSYLTIWYEYGLIGLACLFIPAIWAICSPRFSRAGRVAMLAILANIAFFDFNTFWYGTAATIAIAILALFIPLRCMESSQCVEPKTNSDRGKGF